MNLHQEICPLILQIAESAKEIAESCDNLERRKLQGLVHLVVEARNILSAGESAMPNFRAAPREQIVEKLVAAMDVLSSKAHRPYMTLWQGSYTDDMTTISERLFLVTKGNEVFDAGDHFYYCGPGDKRLVCPEAGAYVEEEDHEAALRGIEYQLDPEWAEREIQAAQAKIEALKECSTKPVAANASWGFSVAAV